MNEELNLEVSSPEATQDHKYEQIDNIKKVQQLLLSLPENQKLVLQLRDVEDYSFEETEESNYGCK